MTTPSPGKRPLREKPQRERWFSQKQYDLLKRCSDKKDLTEWTDWRRRHHRLPVFLDGADLCNACLTGAQLRGAKLRGTKLSDANLESAHLEGADLRGADLGGGRLSKAGFAGAHLERADFSSADLEGAVFWNCHMEEACLHSANSTAADFTEAHLEGAYLQNSHLEGAILLQTHLERAELTSANLGGASLWRANLNGARLRNAHLDDASIIETHLEGTDCTSAIVNGGTYIWDCTIDRATDFTGVGLDEVRVASGLKQLLEYNVRRIGWGKWYRRKPRWLHWWRWVVWPFWAMSDYGRSTVRIIATFFGLAGAFAAAYARWPGMLEGLEAEGSVALGLRALYFSVVTMTTLGFGDIRANPASVCGHWLLMLQVILGYVMLGVLVTRFAILLTSGGPAANHLMQKPWKMPKELEEKLRAIKERRESG